MTAGAWPPGIAIHLIPVQLPVGTGPSLGNGPWGSGGVGVEPGSGGGVSADCAVGLGVRRAGGVGAGVSVERLGEVVGGSVSAAGEVVPPAAE